MADAFIVGGGGGAGGSGSGKSIKDAVVTLDFTSVVWDGEQHQPVVKSVVLNDVPLTEDFDYYIVSEPATIAGTYYVQVVGVIDYSGGVRVPWTIEKAEGSVQLSAGSLTIKGAMGTSNSSITVTRVGDGILSAESQNPGNASAEIVEGNKVKITSVAEGQAKIIVRATGATNHKDAQAEITVSVQRATGSISVQPTELAIKGEKGSTGSATLSITGDGAVTTSMQPDGIVTIQRATNTLTLTSVTEGHTVITIKLAETKNYTGASCTLTVDTQFRLPVSDTLEENTWEAIADAAAAGEAAQHWSVGDIKKVTLTGEDAGTYGLQIIGFDQDVLDPTDAKYSDSSYNGGKKKAAITFQFVELLKTYRKMHTSNDNSCSWEKSDMRVTTMPLVLSEMPSDVKGVMRTVTKKAPQSTSNKNLISTADKLFLLGPHEVFKSPSYADFTAEGELYTYYASGNSTVKNQLGGSAYAWWLRCPATDGAAYFCGVYAGGSSGSGGATGAGGVAAGFCV